MKDLFLVSNPKINDTLPLLILNVENKTCFPPRQRFEAFHKHKDIQFIYVLKGSIIISTLSQKFILKENEGIFINSMILHSVNEKTECHYHSYIFPPQILFGFGTNLYEKYVNKYINDEKITCIKILSDYSSYSKLKELDDLPKTYDDKNNLQIIKSIIALWTEFIFNIPSINTDNSQIPYKNQQIIEKALAYLHQNYNEKLSLKLLCNNCFVSESTLLRLFKQIVRASPYEYLIDYRIKKSIQLLLENKYTIAEIANNVGYNSQSQFCKFFKQKMQTTPSEYIKVKNTKNFFKSSN